MKHLFLIVFVALLSACIQENNPRTLALGDVSIGQQLIDLKSALDAQAISEAEYLLLKENPIASSAMCASSGEEEDDDPGWFF